MTPTTQKRVLRPAVFDAIKRGAEKHGGVGTGTMYRAPGCPVCGIGLAHSEGVIPDLPPATGDDWQWIDDELYLNWVSQFVGFSFCESDSAVDDAIGVLHAPGVRIPFEQWVENLGAVRGVGYPMWVFDYGNNATNRRVTAALERAFETTRVGDVNDRALERINFRKGAPNNLRVTFDEWADELNVIRAST